MFHYETARDLARFTNLMQRRYGERRRREAAEQRAAEGESRREIARREHIRNLEQARTPMPFDHGPYDRHYENAIAENPETTFPTGITDYLSPDHPARTNRPLGVVPRPATPTTEDIAMGELTPEAIEKCRKLAAITFPKQNDNPELLKKFNDAKNNIENSYKKMWDVINGVVPGTVGVVRTHSEVIYNRVVDAYSVQEAFRKGALQDDCIESVKRLARENSLRFSPSGISFAMPKFILKGEVGHVEQGLEVTIDDLRCHVTFARGGIVVKVKGSRPRLHGKWHPHVNSDGTPCTGEIKHYFEARLQEGDVDEAIRVLTDALSNYNDASAYHKLRYFWGFTCKCGNTVAQPRVAYAAVEKDGKLVKEKAECCERCMVACPSCSSYWVKTSSGIRETGGCLHCKQTCNTCKREVGAHQLARIHGDNDIHHCTYCCFGCQECGRWHERSQEAYVRVLTTGTAKLYCKECGTNQIRKKHCIQVHINDMPAVKNTYGGDLAPYVWQEANKLGLKTFAQMEQQAQQVPVSATQGDLL